MEDINYIKNRVLTAAVYIIDNKSTIRKTAEMLGVSKSTVHKDLSDKLPHYDSNLSVKVREILNINKEERHIRGGLATKAKYKNQSKG